MKMVTRGDLAEINNEDVIVEKIDESPKESPGAKRKRPMSGLSSYVAQKQYDSNNYFLTNLINQFDTTATTGR